MKPTSQSGKFETLKAFCLLFRTGILKDFYQKVSIECRCYRPGNYTVSGRMNASFLPGHFTGWGGEGVKRDSSFLHF